MTIVIESYNDKFTDEERCLLYNFDELETNIFRDIKKECLFDTMNEIVKSTTEVVRFIL